MFKLFNDDAYNISNNIKLGLQLANKSIFANHTGIENNIMKDLSIQDGSLGGSTVIDIG
jgi:hypothetical protein